MLVYHQSVPPKSLVRHVAPMVSAVPRCVLIPQTVVDTLTKASTFRPTGTATPAPTRQKSASAARSWLVKLLSRVAAVNGKRGLGLTSMSERLRLVGGQISIESSEARGTQIEVRVPLPRANDG